MPRLKPWELLYDLLHLRTNPPLRPIRDRMRWVVSQGVVDGPAVLAALTRVQQEGGKQVPPLFMVLLIQTLE